MTNDAGCSWIGVRHGKTAKCGRQVSATLFDMTGERPVCPTHEAAGRKVGWSTRRGQMRLAVLDECFGMLK